MLQSINANVLKLGNDPTPAHNETWNILKDCDNLKEYSKRQKVIRLHIMQGCEDASDGEKLYKMLCLVCDRVGNTQLTFRNMHHLKEEYIMSSNEWVQKKHQIYKHLTANKKHLQNVRDVHEAIVYLPLDIQAEAELAYTTSIRAAPDSLFEDLVYLTYRIQRIHNELKISLLSTN